MSGGREAAGTNFTDLPHSPCDSRDTAVSLNTAVEVRMTRLLGFYTAWNLPPQAESARQCRERGVHDTLNIVYIKAAESDRR